MAAMKQPNWLEPWQRAFGNAINQPLTFSTGSLQIQAPPMDPDRCFASATGERVSGSLAVYNRQYWFRLFSTLQGDLAITASLIGPWALNQVLSRALTATPPKSKLLSDLVRALEPALRTAFDAGGWPGAEDALLRAQVQECLTIDLAHLSLLTAPAETPWVPTTAELARLDRLTLRPAGSLRIVTQSAPLLQHRVAPAVPTDGRPLGPLPSLPLPESWALFRHENGMGRLQLRDLEQVFWSQAFDLPLGDLLVKLEQRVDIRPAELATMLRRNLDRAVKLGWLAQPSPVTDTAEERT